MKVANSFGYAALVALSVLLVPVARHSALLRLFSWNPAAAVQLHVWTGRVVVIGVLLHGGLHMLRWKRLLGESIVHMAIVPPPLSCFGIGSSAELSLSCNNEATECDCYARLRNWTGFVAGMALAVIGLSSCNWVRRNFYSVFYRIHIVAGPTVLLFTVLHWNRSMIFVAGGALYYTASSFPVFVEQWRKQRRSDAGVRIVSVERIEGVQRPCMAVTVEASDVAMRRYRAGQYVQLKVPAISSISHPFSINTAGPRQLRIIFRCTGLFTWQFGHQLASVIDEGQSAVEDDTEPADDSVPLLHLPEMYLDGFHGSCNMIQQVFQHDSVVLVAGGIGITTYLSLLQKVHAIASTHGHVLPTKNLTLHWTCRDAELIDYMKREYFGPLLLSEQQSTSTDNSNQTRTRLQIVIHRTAVIDGRDPSVCHNASYSDLENPQADHAAERRTSSVSVIPPEHQRGVAFTPSRFSPGSKSSFRGNVAILLSFATTAGAGLAGTLYSYFHWQSAETILPRLVSPLFIVVLGVVVALALHCCFDRVNGESAKWEPVDSSEEEEDDSTESTVELGEINALSLSPESDALHEPLEEEESPLVVRLEEREGRPTIHQFLNSLDGARQPGLFACGPAGLLCDIRAATRERCAMRLQRCTTGEPHIALYEETFEM